MPSAFSLSGHEVTTSRRREVTNVAVVPVVAVVAVAWMVSVIRLGSVPASLSRFRTGKQRVVRVVVVVVGVARDLDNVPRKQK